MACTKPSILLKGETLRLIDEWQDALVLWDAVRNAVDERGLKGQFILNGSTVIDGSGKEEAQTRMHTDTERVSRMTMYTMSLYESKESSGSISLQQLFDDPDFDIDGAMSTLSIEEIIFAACRGGWPAYLNVKSDKVKLFIAKDYVNVICDEDISKVDNIKRNPILAC